MTKIIKRSPKIVVVGSCKFEPYIILVVPAKVVKNGKNLWNTEEGYKEAFKKFKNAIDECDEVWIYAPDGIGEHTQRDIDYAKSIGKKVRILVDFPLFLPGTMNQEGGIYES